MFRPLTACFSVLLAVSVQAHELDQGEARYIANAGVLVSDNDTQILFDPLFSNTFDRYDPVPGGVLMHILGGFPPFHSVDAVFVSHHHEDHFDPAVLLLLLQRQPQIHLYGPQQAAAAVRELLDTDTADVSSRVHGLKLELGDPAARITVGDLEIDALRLPHAGWPTRHADVQNIVFRVTLDDHMTVMHLGDADTVDEHFAAQPDFWTERRTDVAFPPYWFFLNDEGREIISTRLNTRRAIGVHVPAELPDDPDKRPDELRGVDLFTRPTETRTINLAD